ncbi:MAG: signal peptide peptidase SppA [Deltaproteobacteria bacterium]|nr:signal peptide peptidase SppA [Deltaproteobacteria bacterium]
MATNKHPIIRGLIGLVLALTIFFLFVVILFSLIGRKGELSLSDKIAIVPIKGVITDSQTIIEQLHKFKKHRKVKAIVIRIDSPGGGVGPSQEIYEEIKKIRKTKRVVASIGSIGASGGYYVACAADKIVANPGAIIGSIGVIVEYANFEKLLEKIGLKRIVIKSGKYKDIMSPLRDITEDEKSLIQNVIDNIQSQFVSAVAEGRNLEKAQVEAIADGRIFTGAQAKELGLIDVLGNFHDAINIAAMMVGIKGEPELIYPEKRYSLLDYLIEKTCQKWEEILCFPYRFSYLLTLNP